MAKEKLLLLLLLLEERMRKRVAMRSEEGKGVGRVFAVPFEVVCSVDDVETVVAVFEWGGVEIIVNRERECVIESLCV